MVKEEMSSKELVDVSGALRLVMDDTLVYFKDDHSAPEADHPD